MSRTIGKISMKTKHAVWRDVLCVHTMKIFCIHETTAEVEYQLSLLKYGVWGLAHIIWEKGLEFLMDFKGP